MSNVSKGMEYAAAFEREAMREKLDAVVGDDHMNLIELEAMVLKHEQQIKDIAKHLLELKQLVTPMMEFKRREWVGLTDEEIEKLLDEMSMGCCARDVRIVQEKLKEKNR